MEQTTIIAVGTSSSDWPTDPRTAVVQWLTAALAAETLRVELKASQAHAYLTPPIADGQKVTEGFRDTYAIAQTADLAQKAAAAAAEAKVRERWADFVLERALQGGFTGAVEALDAMKREVLSAGEVSTDGND